MDQPQPRISFIIPTPPEGDYTLSLDSVRKQNYPADKIEILITVGRHRSIQRNEAIGAATGDFIFFLDDDVIIPDENYIRRHIDHYQKDENVCSVGGPSLTPDFNSNLQKAFGQVLASFFATHSVRARYWPVGETRQTDEKELILCNQSMRAAPLKQENGFDQRFHSGNEENELINRLIERGYRLIYDPRIKVFRSQRNKLLSFIQQIAKYGKSRVEHFLIKPGALEVKFMAPVFFLGYVTTLPAVFALPLGPLLRTLYLAPLGLYALLSFGSAAAAYRRCRSLMVTLITWLLYPVHHLAYGLGMLYGIYRYAFPLKRPQPDIIVKKIKL